MIGRSRVAECITIFRLISYARAYRGYMEEPATVCYTVTAHPTEILKHKEIAPLNIRDFLFYVEDISEHENLTPIPVPELAPESSDSGKTGEETKEPALSQASCSCEEGKPEG